MPELKTPLIFCIIKSWGPKLTVNNTWAQCKQNTHTNKPSQHLKYKSRIEQTGQKIVVEEKIQRKLFPCKRALTVPVFRNIFSSKAAPYLSFLKVNSDVWSLQRSYFDFSRYGRREGEPPFLYFYSRYPLDGMPLPPVTYALRNRCHSRKRLQGINFVCSTFQIENYPFFLTKACSASSQMNKWFICFLLFFLNKPFFLDKPYFLFQKLCALLLQSPFP